MTPGICRVCGCTDNNACPEGCSWADSTYTLCTNPICLRVARRTKRLLGAAMNVLKYYRRGPGSDCNTVPYRALERLARAVAKGGAA